MDEGINKEQKYIFMLLFSVLYMDNIQKKV